MSKKVLIRKQMTGGIMYTRDIGRGQGGGFRQDLAALRGGAMGLNPTRWSIIYSPAHNFPGCRTYKDAKIGRRC